jgi:phenylacetate-CoA ligase
MDYSLEKISQVVRRCGFNVLDRIRGGRVSSALVRTRAYYAHPESFASDRADRLQDLLQHARQHIPFYQYLGPGASLADFPVVDKSTIRSEPLAFRDPSVDFSKLAKVTTSGSTGEPFTCYHDRPKQVQKMADLLYYNGLAGYQLGMRHLLMRATPASRRKQWLMNQIWVDPTRWDEQLCESVAKHLIQESVEIAIGYPSVFSDIARFSLGQGYKRDQFALRAFISTSELLSPNQGALIKAAFGCNVVSRYATEEVGVIGQSSANFVSFELNTTSLIIEILNLHNDNPTTEGEMGRVLVTDLNLRAMPLIRYDTGDLAVVKDVSHDRIGVSSLESLEGKTAHVIYDSGGCRVAPLAVLVALKCLEKVYQYQLAQTGVGRYELRIVTDDKTGILEATSALKKVLGKASVIEVKCSPTLPRLQSGKVPVVVNEIEG